MIINKYNELINKYNNLASKKNDEQNKKENNETTIYKNNTFLNSFKRRINSGIKVESSNNSSAKNHISSTNVTNNKKEKKIKNISIIGNNKNINSFDNDYISHLKKENDILKNIIKTYKSINFNSYMKEPKYLYKKRNYFINNTHQIYPDKLKKSISKNNSKDRSYTLKSQNSKNSKNKNDTLNKPSILYKKKKSNNSLIQKIKSMNDYSLTNDSSLYIPKNRKASEISKNKQNFNTINSSSCHYRKNIIKKNNTYVSSISGLINKSCITNQRMINKLKVKCKEYIYNEKNSDLGSSNNLSRDRIISRITPKNIIENNGSFFAQTNYNIKKKYKDGEKIRTYKKLEIDSNNINNSNIYMNNNDNRNHTESNYFYHDTSNNNIEPNINTSQFNRTNTEVNNYNNTNSANANTNMNTINNNLIIHRNIEHKLSNKFRLIKEFKTEKEKNELFSYTNKNSLLYSLNQLSDKNMNKITINRKSIFQKKSNISLRDTAKIKQKMNLNDANDDNINVTDNKQKSKYLMLNNTIIKTKSKNRILLENKNVNKNLFNANKNVIKKSTEKNQTLYQTKKIIGNSARISTLRNNQIRAQNNTINNINNFNNCSYIYLFNNGEKFIKINKQLKI